MATKSRAAPAPAAKPPAAAKPPVAAKPKKGKAPPPSPETVQSGMVTAMQRSREKRSGASGVIVTDDPRAYRIVVPTPSIAHDWLFGMNGFPLGIIYMLVSPPGVGKSTLLAEHLRWHAMASGGGRVVEAENKFVDSQYRALLKNHFGAGRPIDAVPSSSLEDWQRNLTRSIQNLHEYMDGTSDAKAAGRTFPYLLGVDSIMGLSPEELVEKIFGVRNKATGRYGKHEGHGARHHPVAQLVSADYLRVLPSMLADYPINVCFVNQLTRTTDEKGRPKRHVPGGVKFRFAESIELELAQIRDFNAKGFQGKELAISVQKSSLAPDDREIRTRLIWQYSDDEPPVQTTRFDWGWSLVWTLNDILTGTKNLYFKERLVRHGIHVGIVSDAAVGNRAWSKMLNMSAKTALPWSKLGYMMQQNPAVRAKIQSALAIDKRPFLGGRDFGALSAKVKAEAAV